MRGFFFLRVALALVLVSALSAGGARANGIVEVKSPGGITAWLIEDHTLPLIAVDFQFDGGSALTLRRQLQDSGDSADAPAASGAAGAEDADVPHTPTWLCRARCWP